MGKSDLIEKINARANTTKKPQQVVKRVNNSSSSEEREEKDTGEKRITNSRGTVVVRRRVPNPPKQEDSATFVSDNEENNAEPKMLTNPPSNDEKTGSSDIKLALQDETDDSDRILELENKSETPNSNLDSYDDELVPVAQNESTTDDADGYASYDISDSQDLLTHSSLEREHSAAQLSTEKFATSPLQEDGIVTDDSPVTQLDNTAVNQQKNSNSLYEEREQKFRDLTSVAEQSDVTLKKQQEQTKNLKPLRKDHQSSFKSETKISDTLNTSKDISSAKEVTFAKKEHNKNSTENLFSTKKILTIEDVLAEEHGHVPIQNKALIVGEVRKSSPKIPLKTINKQHLQNSVADIQSEKKKPVTKLEESPKPKFNDSDNKDISETSSRVSDDKLKTVTSTKDVASNDRTNEKTSSQHPLGSVASNNTTQNNTQNNQVHNSQSNNLKKEHKYDTKVDNNVSRNQDLNQRNLRPQNNGPRSQFSNTRQEQNSSSTTNNDKHFESTPHNQHASHQNQAMYTNQNSNYSGNLQSDPRAKTLGKNEAFSTMAAALGTLATKNNLPAGKKTIAPTAFKEIVNEEKKREKASTKGRFSKNDFVEDVKAVRGLQQKKVLKKKEVFQPKRDVTTPEVESQFRKFKKTSIKREKAKTKITTPKAIKRLLKIEDTISVSELAHLMSVKAPLLIKKLISLGVMATINQVIDFDTASLLAVEFGYEVENVTFNEDNILNVSDSINEENDLPRPPVVTIMGHVDHGKTTLLDAIRHTDIAGKEAGGITQHIGAYRVETESGQIVFLDTPGHEAFTAMRSRGVKVTDIVILVVAADDGVMPQTVEALNHAKAANVPIIVAINKIDKPGANADRIRQKLAEHELVSEEWGGQTIFAEVSAKSKKGVKELLELILLQAEVLELKANPYRQARATVVESQLDKGKGPLATVLVAQGTLKVGDIVVVGCHYGKIRAMVDDHGKQSKEAGPSIPVEILGLSGVPDAGDTLAVVDDMDVAKSIAENRQEKLRQQQMAKVAKVSLEDLFTQMEKGEVKELKIVLKTDVQGSLEALQKAITDIGTDSVKTQILHAGVGTISEGDVMLASASKAVVLGFNVKADVNALALAERECIQINTYSIIYDAIDHLKKAMLGLLKPVMKEKIIGHAEVRNIFSIPKIGFIAGCSVIDGKIVRNSSIRVMRNAKQVWEGKLASLRRFKDDVKEVEKGYECGIALENYTDLQMNDILEAYIMEEQRPTL